MKAQGFQDCLTALERELSRLEGELVALQRRYEERAGELERLRSLQHRLAAYRLPHDRSLTWAGVCRALGWPPGSGGGHRTVKRRDPSLHALLHLCVFEALCSLDGVSYVP
jgi:hypothetical protein